MAEQRALEQVEQGGEKYLKSARGRLAALAARRKDLGLPVLESQWEPAPGTLVKLRAAEWGDFISISGVAVTRGFRIRPTMVRPSTNTTYFTNLASMKLDSSRVRDIGGGPYTFAGYAFWPGPEGAMSFGSHPEGGYFKNGRFKEVTAPGFVSPQVLPFKHNYVAVVDGVPVPLTRDLAVGFTVSSSSSVADLQASGALLSDSGPAGPVHDISPNGKKAVGLVGDVKSSLVIDFAATPQVTRTQQTLSGYGSSVDSQDNVAVYSDNTSLGPIEYVPSDPPETAGQWQSLTGSDGSVGHNIILSSSSATYPVCFGYDEGSNEVQMSVVDVQSTDSQGYASSSRIFDGHIFLIPGGGGVFIGDISTSSSSSGSYTSLKTKKLAMPNGVERTFVISQVSRSDGGSASRTEGALTILYADASRSIVVYKYVKDTYVGTAFNPGHVPGTIVTETTVVALVGTAEYALFSSTASAPEGGNSWPNYSPASIPGFSFSIQTSNTTPLNINVIDSPDARRQSTDVNLAVSGDKHVIQYRVATPLAYNMAGTGDHAKAATVYMFKKLAKGSALLSAADRILFLAAMLLKLPAEQAALLATLPAADQISVQAAMLTVDHAQYLVKLEDFLVSGGIGLL